MAGSGCRTSSGYPRTRRRSTTPRVGRPTGSIRSLSLSGWKNSLPNSATRVGGRIRDVGRAGPPAAPDEPCRPALTANHGRRWGATCRGIPDCHFRGAFRRRERRRTSSIRLAVRLDDLPGERLPVSGRHLFDHLGGLAARRHDPSTTWTGDRCARGADQPTVLRLAYRYLRHDRAALVRSGSVAVPVGLLGLDPPDRHPADRVLVAGASLADQNLRVAGLIVRRRRSVR